LSSVQQKISNIESLVISDNYEISSDITANKNTSHDNLNFDFESNARKIIESSLEFSIFQLERESNFIESRSSQTSLVQTSLIQTSSVQTSFLQNSRSDNLAISQTLSLVLQCTRVRSNQRVQALRSSNLKEIREFFAIEIFLSVINISEKRVSQKRSFTTKTIESSKTSTISTLSEEYFKNASLTNFRYQSFQEFVQRNINFDFLNSIFSKSLESQSRFITTQSTESSFVSTSRKSEISIEQYLTQSTFDSHQKKIIKKNITIQHEWKKKFLHNHTSLVHYILVTTTRKFIFFVFNFIFWFFISSISFIIFLRFFYFFCKVHIFQ
jgi:hypothetical protein